MTRMTVEVSRHSGLGDPFGLIGMALPLGRSEVRILASTRSIYDVFTLQEWREATRPFHVA